MFRYSQFVDLQRHLSWSNIGQSLCKNTFNFLMMMFWSSKHGMLPLSYPEWHFVQSCYKQLVDKNAKEGLKKCDLFLYLIYDFLVIMSVV